MTSANDYTHLTVDRDGPVTTVRLNRPDALNAFDAVLIDDITRAFAALNDDAQTRTVVLASAGSAFSAGADVNWMRDSITYTRRQNVEDATNLARMLASITACSKPVISRVHGLAVGGALGLIAASDYVIAADAARFAFTEVKLGLVPAVIAPFVIQRIGAGHARPLFLTGERFGCDRAQRIGLVHSVTTADELDAEVERVANELATSAPDAVTVCKRLLDRIAFSLPDEALAQTVETIATKRTDPEGQEGLSAFLDRRRPAWMPESHEPSWLRSRSRA